MLLYHATTPPLLFPILDEGILVGASRFQGNVGQGGVSTTTDLSVLTGGDFGNVILVLDTSKMGAGFELVPTDYWGDDREKEIRVVSAGGGPTVIPPQAITKVLRVSPELPGYEVKEITARGLPVESVWKGKTMRYGRKRKNPVRKTPPYHGRREEKVIDSTSTHVLWETKYGSKKYWMITDYEGVMVDEHGVGFARKREAASAWADYKSRKNPMVRIEALSEWDDDQTLDLDNLGRGQFKKAYRTKGRKPKAIVVSDTDSYDHEILGAACSAYEGTRYAAKKHIPCTKKIGWQGDKQVYEMDLYRAPLRKGDSPKAWEQYVLLKKANEQALQETGAYASGYSIYDNIRGLDRTLEIFKKMPGRQKSVYEALETIKDEMANYGSTYRWEFTPRNLATDSKGNLILLDVFFDQQTLQRRMDEYAEMQARRDARVLAWKRADAEWKRAEPERLAKKKRAAAEWKRGEPERLAEKKRAEAEGLVWDGLRWVAPTSRLRLSLPQYQPFFQKNPPQTSRHPMLLRHIVRGMFVQGSDPNATKTKAQIKKLVVMYGKHDLDPREELNLAFGTATNSLVDSGKIRKSKDDRRWVLTDKGKRASDKKRRDQGPAVMRRKDQQYEWILEFTRKGRR